MSLIWKRIAVYRCLISILFCFLLVLSSQAQGTRGAPNPFSRGNVEAPFQIEIFYDFQCPTCAEFHKTLTSVAEKHAEKIRITVRHFPLVKIHDKAYDAAAAVEAAGEQGKFWEMADLVLQNQKKWSNSARYLRMFTAYAKSLNLDSARFEDYMAGMGVRGGIDLDIQRARSLELVAVPTVILNGRKLSIIEAMELEQISSKGN